MLLGAVELGGSKVLCAVGTHANIVGQTRIETTDPETTLAAVEAFFAPYQAQLGALGIAAFGPLELNPQAAQWGSLLRTPKPAWSGAPVATRLRDALRIPVAIDTDVNAAALAEYLGGAARDTAHVAYITVGTGIGVGVVLAGRTLQGLLHPELGHIPAAGFCDFAGTCPFHGRCLEGVASAPALRLRTGVNPDALADHDPVWDLEARYLAQLVQTVVLAYSPHRIVLGGGVLSRRGLLERVREQVLVLLAGYVPRPQLTEAGMSSYLVAPQFEDRAGLMGAFFMAEELVR